MPKKQETFAGLFIKACGNESDEVIARRAHCQVAVVRYYKAGEHKPMDIGYLERFRFLWPDDADWKKVKMIWEGERATITREYNHSLGMLSNDPASETGKCVHALRIKYRIAQKELGFPTSLIGLIELGRVIPTPTMIDSFLNSLCRADEDRAILRSAYKSDLLEAQNGFATGR